MFTLCNASGLDEPNSRNMLSLIDPSDKIAL